MKPLIRVMKALSDPNRIKIIKLLEQKELCVCELTTALGLAQSTVSKHLKQLEDADLVTYSKENNWVNYRLNPEEDSPYAQAILAMIEHWLNDDKVISDLVARLDQYDRTLISSIK